MNKKSKFLLPLLFSITLILGIFLGYQVSEEIPKFRNVIVPTQKNTLEEIFYLIKNRYVENVNVDSIIGNTVGNIVSSLDPHSIYIQPKYLEEINEELDGKFEGIGVEYNIFKDTPVVLRVMQDGPAYKAGIQMGDKLLYANDSLLISKNRDINRVKNNIKGPRSSNVKLKILRQNKILEINVVRGVIPIKSVPVAVMINDSIGYIKIDKFIGETARDFIAGLQALKKQNLKELILDLRNNGGGLLDVAIEIADEFLSGEKLIVYTKGLHYPKKEYKSRRNGLFEEGKLVVLLNGYSASASEVLAGALQDWDRATIMGTNSFGKGLVQEQFELKNGAAIRLTVAKYYTPSGRCIQRKFNYDEKGIPQYTITDFEDTTNMKTDTFRTASGKFVFAENGLRPDIFISSKNLFNDTLLSRLKNQSYFYFFAHKLLQENINNFLRFKTIAEFQNNFQLNNADFENLITLLSKVISQKQIEDIRKNKVEVLKEVKTSLLQLIWSEKETFPFVSKTDTYINRALQVLKNK